MEDFNDLQRELTDEEKLNPVSSGAVEWHDPLDKPKPSQEQPTGKLALASTLLGAAALCMVCAAPAAAVLGTAGLVCGILSGSRHEDAKGLRTAGIVLSVGALCAALVVLIMHFALVLGAKNGSSYYNDIEQNLGL